MMRSEDKHGASTVEAPKLALLGGVFGLVAQMVERGVCDLSPSSQVRILPSPFRSQGSDQVGDGSPFSFDPFIPGE